MMSPVDGGASAQVKSRSDAPDPAPANVSANAITLDEARRRAVLTVDEAASLLEISRSSAYEAVRAGQVPAIRIGRRLRVPARSLMVMLGVEPDEESDA